MQIKFAFLHLGLLVLRVTATKDSKKTVNSLTPILKKKETFNLLLEGMSAKDSLKEIAKEIAKEYKQRYPGPHYKKITNWKLSRPWTQTELGLEGKLQGVPAFPTPKKQSLAQIKFLTTH